MKWIRNIGVLIKDKTAFVVAILAAAVVLITIGWNKSEDWLKHVWKKWQKTKLRFKIEVIILFILVLYLFYKTGGLVFGQ